MKSYCTQCVLSLTLNVGDISIKQVPCIRLLGVILDEKISWAHHVTNLLSKLSSGVHSIRSLKNLTNPEIKQSIYMANIQRHMLYALNVWGPIISSRDQKLLENKMIKGQKSINCKMNDAEIRKKYKLLTFSELVKTGLCKLSYRYENDSLPIRLRNLFDLTNHNYNTRNANAPRTPVHGTQKYNKSFICKAPSDWLSLSNEIKNSKSVKILAKRIRNSLFLGPTSSSLSHSFPVVYLINCILCIKLLRLDDTLR